MAEETQETQETREAQDATRPGSPGTPYAVLARKYRSRTFDEVVGQAHVADTLKKAIETGRVHHAYLFCGTRGVGKTSMARILALALNDPTSDGPTPAPDPTTDVADAIFKGQDVDVVEIDAASNTGVDHVRDLIENARFRPMRSRFKVYIIDEVHMLSKAAFNALLKIMEEPPGHVKFILATTEPERVLATILSRVQRFDFRNIPAGEIVAHLEEVVGNEGRRADADALRLVARNGQGSMRDSLSLLDRLLSGTGAGETLGADDVTRLLGLPPRQRVFDLAQAVGGGDAKAALALADDLLAGGQSGDSLVAALTDHLHALLVRRVVGGGAELAEVPGLDDAAVGEQAGRFEPAALSQAVAILEELRRQMRGGGAGRALLDATLVRLALAAHFAPGAGLPAAPAVPAQKKTPEVSEPEPSGPSGQDLWPRVLAAVGRHHETLAPILRDARFDGYDAAANAASVAYPHESRFFAESIARVPDKQKALAAAFAEALGRDGDPPAVSVRVLDPGQSPPPSSAVNGVAGVAGERDLPPGGAPLPRAASAPPADLDLEADPLVQAAVREFGARVVKIEDE